MPVHAERNEWKQIQLKNYGTFIHHDRSSNLDSEKRHQEHGVFFSSSSGQYLAVLSDTWDTEIRVSLPT
jgi:hypothetical protein